MPRNARITVPSTEYVQLTNSDVSGISIVCDGYSSLSVVVTVGTVQPTSSAGEMVLYTGDVITSDQSFEDLFPGVPGANRVWARAYGKYGAAEVNHA